MKYKEIVYIINDLCKQFSDDSTLTEDHIMFLLNKYRGALLQQYLNIKKVLPESNYQTICLDLEPIDGIPCIEGAKLKSFKKIPDMIPIGNPSLYSFDYFASIITLVSKERMRFVGYNKALGNQIYGAIGPDKHLYLKSCNPQLMYLTKAMLTAVFEDVQAASELACEDSTENTCDIMEQEFPIEASLLPQLIQQVLKDILGAAYRPQDSSNNAQDDLANLAYFLAKNVKSDLAKQMDGTA